MSLAERDVDFSYGLEPIPFQEEQGLVCQYNPTNEKARDFADHLRLEGQRLWPGDGPVRVLPTEVDDVDNAELLRAQQAEGPKHLMIVGGDGTCNKVLKSAIASSFKGVASVKPVGNANDLSASISDSYYAKHPIDSFRDGVVDHIRPVDAIVEGPDGSIQTLTFMSYGGIGLSAVVGEYFDSKEYREAPKAPHRVTQYANEAKITLGFFNNALSFTVDDHQHDPHQAIEFLVLNGGRMAKTRFLPYAHLFADHATVAEIGSNRKRDFAKAAGKLMLGGKRFQLGESVCVTVTSETGDPLLFQTDGEINQILSGSTVTYQFADDDSRVKVARTRF